ncbi:hypothetical protein AB0903_22180 [Streptomyces sp. NPDC048389]|uniref:hypothetical protein n=1 Tax=Streptomyces sp. NPDC048389 TaxID=3154622 RepID=UPI003454108D
MADSLVGFRPAVEAALEAVSLVRLHGPDRVARAANNLASAMNGWCHEVELLYDGGGDEQRASEAIELYEEMEERFLVGLGQVGAGVGMPRWQVGQTPVHVARRVCSSRTTW